MLIVEEAESVNTAVKEHYALIVVEARYASTTAVDQLALIVEEAVSASTTSKGWSARSVLCAVMPIALKNPHTDLRDLVGWTSVLLTRRRGACSSGNRAQYAWTTT